VQHEGEVQVCGDPWHRPNEVSSAPAAQTHAPASQVEITARVEQLELWAHRCALAFKLPCPFGCRGCHSQIPGFVKGVDYAR